jgi:homoserine kinase
MQAISVRVPASISNLGPGFDCLGVALPLYNRTTVTRAGQATRLPGIVDEAARLFFKEAALQPFRFSCTISGKVPRARGLGSSASVRLGTLHCLNRLAGKPLDHIALFHLCTRLESHPDNAAAALFGGFTVAQAGTVQRCDVSPRLKFVLLIPDCEVKTSAARKILPPRITRTKAVESCGNACAITGAFMSRNYPALRGRFDDQFHQPFRSRLIPFMPRVIAAAEEAGALGAFLSGSGSTIAAVTLDSPDKVARAMLRAMHNTKANTIIVSADNDGVEAVESK